jgi:uncharacterized protein (UPF0333 family)
MTPEERELLSQSIKLAEENNKMLRGIRRSNRFSLFLRIIYWLIILAIAFIAYYYIQPYVNAAIKSYNDMKNNVQSVKNISTNLPSLPSWLGGKQ